MTKEYLDIIEEEAKRLADMATNVLNMTKLENQTILTDISKFNLSEQIRSSVLLLEEKWIKRNLEFNLDFEEYEIEAMKIANELREWLNVQTNISDRSFNAQMKYANKINAITYQILA